MTGKGLKSFQVNDFVMTKSLDHILAASACMNYGLRLLQLMRNLSQCSFIEFSEVLYRVCA